MRYTARESGRGTRPCHWWYVSVSVTLISASLTQSPRIIYKQADTVVLTHAQPFTSGTSYSVLPDIHQELLEKPTSKADNLRMLLDMNGGVCEVVTGVSIGKYASYFPFFASHVRKHRGKIFLFHPLTYLCVLQYIPFLHLRVMTLSEQLPPSLSIRKLLLTLQSSLLNRSIDERSLVHFSDNPRHLLEAYAENGEGVDRAGGFAIQVRQTDPNTYS